MLPLAVLATAACADAPALAVGAAVPVHWYRAAQLALEESGGAAVTMLWDTAPGLGGGAAGAVSWADWHVRQGVRVVIGHDASRPSVGAAAVYNREGLVQLAPVATSALLEGQGSWSYGLVPNDAVQGAFIAAFVDSVLHGRRVGVLYNNDEFGRGVRDAAVAHLAERGIPIVDERFFAPPGALASGAGLRPLFAAARAARPDVIIIAGHHPEVRLLAAFLRGQPGAPAIVSADAGLVLMPGDTARRGLAHLEGLYVVRLWDPSAPDAARFVERFRARFGEPPDVAEAFTYEATRLVIAAAEAGARDAADVRGWLQQLGRERPPFRGITGDLAFRDGRPFVTRLWMAQVQGGRLTTVLEAPVP